VVQATAHADFQLTPTVAVRFALGWIRSPGGLLGSTTVGAMLNFTDGVSPGD
jgi:hypothetical protein